MKMLNRLKRSSLPLMALGVIFILASHAQAMCVYNDMDTTLRVQFDCGTFCSNDWAISSGSFNCRPNQAGTVYGGGESVPLFVLPVGAHDYVVVSTVSGSQRQACLYRSDDSAAGCTAFTFPL